VEYDAHRHSGDLHRLLSHPVATLLKRRLRQLADLLDEGKGRHIVARELLASAPQLGEDLRIERLRLPLAPAGGLWPIRTAMLLRAAKLPELLVTLHGADGFVRIQLAASNRRVRGAAIGAHRTDRPIPRRLAAAGGRIGGFVATRISLTLLVSYVVGASAAWAAVPSRHAVILPERTSHRSRFARVKILAAQITELADIVLPLR